MFLLSSLLSLLCSSLSSLWHWTSPAAAEGSSPGVGDHVATVTGPVRSVLRARRTALGCLRHCSIAASAAAAAVDATERARELGWDGTVVAGMEEGMPGLGMLEEYGSSGGGKFPFHRCRFLMFYPVR